MKNHSAVLTQLYRQHLLGFMNIFATLFYMADNRLYTLKMSSMISRLIDCAYLFSVHDFTPDWLYLPVFRCCLDRTWLCLRAWRTVACRRYHKLRHLVDKELALTLIVLHPRTKCWHNVHLSVPRKQCRWSALIWNQFGRHLNKLCCSISSILCIDCIANHFSDSRIAEDQLSDSNV